MRREELKMELEKLYMVSDKLEEKVREIKREIKNEINNEISDRLIEIGLKDYSWDISEVNDEVIQGLLEEIEEWCF